MGISSDVLSQLERLMRPHATRIANMVTRGVVQLVADSGMLQLVQVGALAGETIDGGRGGGAEHFQSYGLSSVPLVGAEAIVVFPAGDRSHPIVIGVPDRRYRPTGGNPGDVVVYNSTGTKITLSGANIVLEPAGGGAVLLGSASAVQPAVLGNALLTALNTFISSLASAVAGIPTGGAAAGAAITAAGTAFDTAASTFLSTVTKGQ